MYPWFLKFWVVIVVLLAGVVTLLMPFLPPLAAPQPMDYLWRVLLIVSSVALGGAMASVHFWGLTRTQALYLIASGLSSGLCYAFLRFQIHAYCERLNGPHHFGSLALAEPLLKEAKFAVSDSNLALFVPCILGVIATAHWGARQWGVRKP